MDIKINFVTKGKGEPLIFLHGNGEDHMYFYPQINYFGGKYKVYAIDSRWHGNTPRGTMPITLDQFAEDLKDFMNEQGIAKAHIWGFSDGANVAMIFAIKYCERCQSLILNAGNLYPPGIKPECLDEIVNEKKQIRSSKRKDKDRELALLDLMILEPSIRAAKLANIKVPCLVVAGDDDVIKESHTELIANCLPDAELKILTGDHFISHENPKLFNKVAEDFLTKHSFL